MLTNAIAVTIAKSLKHDYDVLMKHAYTTVDLAARQELLKEIKAYETALLWLGSQPVMGRKLI